MHAQVAILQVDLEAWIDRWLLCTGPETILQQRLLSKAKLCVKRGRKEIMLSFLTRQFDCARISREKQTCPKRTAGHHSCC